MRILSDEQVASIRAKYPDRKQRKKPSPVLTTKVLRDFTARAIKELNSGPKPRSFKVRMNQAVTTFRETSRPCFLRKKPRRAPNRCYHWCPLGMHEWNHNIAAMESVLDAWRLPCPECSK